MILNRANLSAFTTGLQTRFNTGLLTAPELTYMQYAMTVPSSTSVEQYAFLSSMPGLREWVGERQLNNLRTYDFSIKNKKYEGTLEVPREMIEDDQFGIYGPMAEGLGNEAARHPQELIDSLVNNGFANLCYDGQTFFSTSHPVTNTDGTTSLVSNNQGGAGSAWFLIDTSRAFKPFILQQRKAPQFVSRTSEDSDTVFQRSMYQYGVDWRGNVGYGLWQLAYASKQTLNDANYELARAAMRNTIGDNNRKLGLNPRILLVSPTLEQPARRLVEAEANAAGATNVNRGTTKVVVSSYLN